MRLSLQQQKKCVAEIKSLMHRWYRVQPPEKGGIDKYCIFWAYFTMLVLCRHKIPAQIQAGTAYWPTVSEDTDDGISPNQVGYRFTWDEEAKRKLMCREVPELHAWVAVAEEPQEIIDITAPFFKSRALEYGLKFTAPDPPEFLWCEIQNLPKHVNYQASLKAIEVVYALLTSALSGDPFVVRL